MTSMMASPWETEAVAEVGVAREAAVTVGTNVEWPAGTTVAMTADLRETRHPRLALPLRRRPLLLPTTSATSMRSVMAAAAVVVPILSVTIPLPTIRLHRLQRLLRLRRSQRQQQRMTSLEGIRLARQPPPPPLHRLCKLQHPLLQGAWTTFSGQLQLQRLLQSPPQQ